MILNIECGTRECTVDGEVGLFQLWEQYSQPLEASPFIGGAPAGVYSRVYGIVEFPEGVRRVDPEKIIFCDTTSQKLAAFRKENKNVQ